jgi:hypothetical protein
MQLTARQLNRATLSRQWLLDRRKADVVDAIRAVCALQAQSPASPYIALWNRVARFDPAELDRAYIEHRVVKATLMRMTLHAVAADDYAAFHHAMVDDLRRSRLLDGRFRSIGLSFDEADALMAAVLEFAAEARTNAELHAMLEQRTGKLPAPGPWWALKTFAPMLHAPTGGPWSFSDRPSYLSAPSGGVRGSREQSVAKLLRSYLAAFGPASAADVNQFTMIPQPPIRAALDVLADELVIHEDPAGKVLYDIRGSELPEEEVVAPPRLMAMWDNILLAYRDRTRVIPEAYRKLVIRSNGDTLPTVLVDGYVAGVWRPAAEPAKGVEITAFHGFDDATWAALDTEARSLLGLVAERQPDVYRRYGRWWADVPAAEVQLLGGH